MQTRDDDRTEILAIIDEHADQWAAGTVCLTMVNPPPPPAVAPGYVRRFSGASFQYVITGELPFSYAAPSGDLRRTVLRPGDCYYSVANGWDLRGHETARKLLGVVMMSDQVRFTVTDRDIGTPTGHAIRQWYHTSASIGPCGALIVQALDTCAHNDLGDDEAGALMRALVHFARKSLAEDTPTVHGRAHATWRLLVDYVNRHYGEPIDRNSVAAEFRLAPDYVSHLFRREGREGFNQYLTRLRMQRAIQLLDDGRFRIGEVARRCGYTSDGYFIKAFRRIHGTTPGRYRTGSPNTA